MSNDVDWEWEQRSKRPGMPKNSPPNANDRESGTRNKRRTTSTNYQTDRRNQARSSGRNATKEPYVYPGFDLSSTLGIKRGKTGNGNNGNQGNSNNPEAEVYARPIVPISQIQVPIGSGQVVNPNMREAYIKEVQRLTLSLISSADSLLFAYNFTTINRITSYMLERDDANLRSTGVVSNFRRPGSGVPLTQLEIEDRLTSVINLIANTIGDNVPSNSKLQLFGNKKENLDFQGGMPRIDNRTSYYDLKLDLPQLSSPEYSVRYTIKCYDIS
jgi:hypothetical protein